METYENLEVFKESHLFVLKLYKVIKNFPVEERFRLSDQICRAAISVPANIAEAFGRHSVNEKIHFLYISRSSVEEIKYYLLLAEDLDYITLKQYNELRISIDKIGKMLNALINSLKTKQLNNKITRRLNN